MNALSVIRFISSHPLNQSAPLAAISRFIRWQIASRLIKAPVALPFTENTRLLVENGMTGATGNWYCGLHEPEEMGFALHALRSGDLFLDIGANIGSYTILAAGARGARAIAIEPVPSTFAKLEANVRLNGLSANVQTLCCGLSSEPGIIRFTATLDTMNRVALPGETLPTISVPVRTIDDVCANNIPQIIKIDVEGHETSVLSGGEHTLISERVEAVVMETNGSGTKFGISDQDISDKMMRFGFRPYRYDPFKRTFADYANGNNTIFIRDVEKLSNKCQQASPVNLINGTI
ncbi:FkbM family methyltransferase [Sphingomonas flavalba]|uniref:FkbM family methyltransferase n=1 Tax=Sphingomonas flavalba TaxID=2559804 RepID=UPI00109DE5A6|nr:FkbM family methyltransferase [Sphingomonas flavalba]